MRFSAALVSVLVSTHHCKILPTDMFSPEMLVTFFKNPGDLYCSPSEPQQLQTEITRRVETHQKSL